MDDARKTVPNWEHNIEKTNINTENVATRMFKNIEDPVNHPKHYTEGGIEVIQYIRAKLGKDGYIAYCMGNVYKYTSRYKHKGGVQDLQKAKVYLDWAIQEYIKG